jgi:hypothetical protein
MPQERRDAVWKSDCAALGVIGPKKFRINAAIWIVSKGT